MVRVYLAGNVFETEYRETVKKYYGNKLTIVDPMDRPGVTIDIKNKKIEHTESWAEIVENDKALIDGCSILVAVINQYSAGTCMEILYAFNRNIPVYLIVAPGKGFDSDIWLGYHSTQIFYDTNKCYRHILKQIK